MITIKDSLGTVLFEHECETVREAVEKMIRDEIELTFVILKGADLRGADFTGIKEYLWMPNFEGADLTGADFTGVKMESPEFSGTKLIEAKLCNTIVHGGDFQGADLRGADMRGCCFSDLSLCDANMSGANLKGASMAKVFAHRNNLSGANLTNLYTYRTDFKKDYLSE